MGLLGDTNIAEGIEFGIHRMLSVQFFISQADLYKETSTTIE